MLRGIEQSEEFPLLGMVGSGGIACSGTDAAILLSDEFLLGEVLRTAESPEIAPLLVKPLRSGLGKAITDRLHEQGGVVVMIVLKGIGILTNLRTCRDGKATDRVDTTGITRRNEVG